MCDECLRRAKRSLQGNVGRPARLASQRKSLKYEVFKHYGEACSCCGEAHPEFLTVDHINGYTGGPRSGDNLYRWMRRNGYPVGFRTRCMNCNWAARNSPDNLCPHERDRKSEA